MGRFWMTPGRLSLLAALVLWPVQAHPLVQRKPWLVGLGAVLAFLFLLFVLTVVYAIWCSESRHRWASFSLSLSLSPLSSAPLRVPLSTGPYPLVMPCPLRVL